MKLRTWRDSEDLTLDKVRSRLPARFRQVPLSTISRIETGKIKRPNPQLSIALSRLTRGQVSLADIIADRAWAAYVEILSEGKAA